MSHEAVITLVVLGGTVLLLVTEWVPPGVAGVCAIVALVALDVLPAREGFGTLTSSAAITVASMYVLSAAVVRTGAAADLADRLTAGDPRSAFLMLLGATMLLSGFINNTALILIFLPLVLGLARRMEEAPSRLLIPFSFVSILGGSATLIGTSTNLIVASSLRDVSNGVLELGMFDFTRLGLILAVAGGVVVVVLRRRVLPERPSFDFLAQPGVAAEYVTEVTVLEDDPIAGRTLGQVQAEAILGKGIRILQLVRGELVHPPSSDVVLAENDLLLVKGDPAAVLDLRLAEGRRASEGSRSDAVRGVELRLFELVVTPGSPWIDRTLARIRLREDYDARVFAVQRHGAHLREKIDRLALQPGDVLLLQGSEAAMQRLRNTRGVLVIEGVDRLAPNTRRAARSVLALVGFVVLAVTGIVEVEVAAMGAALFAVLAGCLTVRRAYESMDWDVLLVIAGTLALGLAFTRTGLAEASAEGVVAFASGFGSHAVLAVLLLFTAVLTQILSNNATAAVMTPIAYAIGIQLAPADPLPFVVAVAFGANCSFLTPFSYNTNLIVYGPGGYRFGDFFRLGLPVAAVFLGIAILLLPVLY